MIQIELETTELKNLVLGKSKKINTQPILEGIGHIIRNEILQQIDDMNLIDNGTFKNSIRSEVIGKDTVVVHDGVDYGVYLEFGTRPHLIKPKNKPFLHFKIGDKFIKTKKVNHPGFKAYAPFRKGLDKAIPKIETFLNERLN